PRLFDQFDDLDRLVAALCACRAERAESGAGEISGTVPDGGTGEDGGAELFVHAFESRGDVHRVAHRRVLPALGGADAADYRNAGVQPEAGDEFGTPCPGAFRVE